ncbi:MAG: hypothetical protein HRF47_09415 [Chloroflexota bacterium]|jgi:DNA topoisomerase-1
MNLAVVPSEQEALRLAEACTGEWTVAAREERIEDEAPPLPYTTADLLEDASLRLGWTAEQTMAAAQSLFEQGLITYPRTDSPRVSPEARQAARQVIAERYGADAWGNLSPAEGSEQDAHEAIRPSDPQRAPDGLSIPPQEQALYRLIWGRFLAAHMRPAKVKVVTVILEK